MPKRGIDADSRIFFDQLVSLAASRLKATGAIRLEDRHGIITFGDKQKLVGVAHTVFTNGAMISIVSGLKSRASQRCRNTLPSDA